MHDIELSASIIDLEHSLSGAVFWESAGTTPASPAKKPSWKETLVAPQMQLEQCQQKLNQLVPVTKSQENQLKKTTKLRFRLERGGDSSDREKLFSKYFRLC
jgi:hypothetical protein